MARVNNLSNFLTDVADAIKTKKGYQSSQKIPAANFDTEINNIITVNNQNKTVNPSTSQQIVTPDASYNGLGQVIINAVTNAIDTNIQSGNIKYGVTILGVPGSLEEGEMSEQDYEDALDIADDILGIPSYEIVPFATATDAQISALLDAHYRGDIDLSEIWNVGDTRVIHINALSAPVAGSNKAHIAQDMTFRIIGFKHDNLTTPINGITKAAVTIECKELLGDYGTSEYDYDYLSASFDGSTYENPKFFNNAYRRTWLNNNFVDALPATFKTLVKEVVKRNLQGHSNTTNYVETNDKVFLLSYPEIFSSTYNFYRTGAALNDFEGTQYAYYSQNDSNAGRIKYVNNNGSASSAAKSYWLRSPSSNFGSTWCRVYSDGSASDNFCNSTCGLAPALAI